MSEYLYIIPVLLFSVIIHEYAHGWVAKQCGDPTASFLGRLTLNPIPHIDLFGSVILPVLLILSHSSFFIAWAKPVPVNPENFKKPRRDDILVSLAGPLSNILLAIMFTFIYILAVNGSPDAPKDSLAFFLQKMFLSGISLNVVLAIFNLIPLPPLDGSHVLASLLPPAVGNKFRTLGFAGVFIVVFLLQVSFIRNFFYKILEICLEPFRIILDIFLK
jgi:Zn-dependent protease